MKTCSKCGVSKPLNEFFARKSGSSDGRMSSCKDCKTKAIYAWREKNRTQLNEYQRDYYHRQDVKEKVSAYHASEHGRELGRKRDAKRADKKKAWRQNNVESCRVYSRNKHAKRKVAINATAEKITPKDWYGIVAMYQGCCYYCGTKTKMTMEHMIPLSKGGSHSKDNIVPACMPCNRKKHANDNYEFAKQFGRLF